MHYQTIMKNKKLIESIEEIKKGNYLVLVEGKKDRKALQSFGIRRIIELKNRPLFQVVEAINEKGEDLTEIVKKNFDFKPRSIIKKLDLQKPIFRQTATYGHFGKDNLPWEKIEKIN